MKNNLLNLALDVDDKHFHAYGICKETGETISFKCRPCLKAFKSKIEKHASDYNLRICYEAGHLGYSLCRELRKEFGSCEVIAPSLIPQLRGRKVKTDRIDAEKLAEFYMNDQLTIIDIPEAEDEADRDLIRTRSFLVEHLKRLKLHINAITRRQGWSYKEEKGRKDLFSEKYFEWLSQKKSKVKIISLKQNLEILIITFEQLQQSIELYDSSIEEMASSKKYEKKVKSLTAFRGIKNLTALTLITEIGDIKRFNHPRKLMSYSGLDIVEYTSGGDIRKRGITKMGRKQIRTALIEANQFCKNPPRVTKDLKRRRNGSDPKVIAIADKCMRRLHKKSKMMFERNKHPNKVKVACAREMIGFIWNTLNTVD